MPYIQEISTDNQRVLIVADRKTQFLHMLIGAIQKSDVRVDVSEVMPDNFEKYDAYFFIQHPGVLASEFIDFPDKRFICIFFDLDSVAHTLSSFARDQNAPNIKAINLQTSPEHYPKDIETILWFSFSQSGDSYLHLSHPDLKPKIQKQPDVKKIKKPFSLTPKRFLFIGILVILVSNVLFIPPLLIGTYLTYREAHTKLKQPSYKAHTEPNASINLARVLYRYSGPTLHLFSLARPFDDIFQINTSVDSLLASMDTIEKDGQDFTELLLIKNKSEAETKRTAEKKTALFAELRAIQDDLLILEQKIPQNTQELRDIKKKLTYYNAIIPSILEFEPYIDTFFGRGTEKKYLLLFANNMELRPGGGFIGSFAILTMHNYEMKDLRVYDVYDADGQLTEHIAPPKPISEILQQPFWFVRDSAFTPDFVSNFGEAEGLLEKEIQENNFDGGMLFTTTAVQNVLEAINELYIPDYNETITRDNFYLKAQLYAEKDFFPGSIQKKRFLASVMNHMLLNLGTIPLPKLMEQTQKSLNEKQLVMYSKDKKLQEYLEKNYWAGRTLKPRCNLPAAINCILDYAFPLDANLGVNKANFFIQRPTRIQVAIDDSGRITNTLELEYSNSSHDDIFPGGTYKNYFQLMLPPNTRVNSVTIDGTAVEEYDETNFEYKIVGFLMSVPPQNTRTVKITYTLPTSIIKGSGTYQLIFQKQIGSANDNLELEFEIPHNIAIVNNNFSPLVKENKIIYNTSLNSDKIFLMEFTKE